VLVCTQEKGFNEVILKAMGRAINKTVTIAEIIKRRIPNLHQITEISSTDITDVYEPLEEGLDTYVRPLSALLCSLALALRRLLCARVRV
jgi:DNA-binding protein Alba